VAHISCIVYFSFVCPLMAHSVPKSLILWY